jgi:hypothetical protein
MKKNLLASLLIAASATIAVPAFASGYGPAPHYNPSVGAPTSQQGQNTQSIAADEAQNRGDVTAYGGSSTLSQSGKRSQETKAQSVFYGQ